VKLDNGANEPGMVGEPVAGAVGGQVTNVSLTHVSADATPSSSNTAAITQ
jgi:hypothetical protein